MNTRLLFLNLLIVCCAFPFISPSQVLYKNNISAVPSLAYNPGPGTGGKPIIMFDDVNISSGLIGNADSIGITQLKVAIGRTAGAPAVTVNLYITGIDPAATTFDSLPAVPPRFLASFNLAFGDPSTLIVVGDSANPFYTIKTDTGYVYTGYQTIFVGASFSTPDITTGWLLSTGPDYNDDVAFQFDSLNLILPRFAFNFGGTTDDPVASFYTEAYGKLLFSSPTPVTLKDFTVTKRNTQNLITWKTETEINSSYFAIERGKDGRNFQSIGQVTAAGTSNSLLNYQFTDNAPYKGTNYYRLRSVDKDNKVTYSIIKSIRNYGATAMTVYPNPVTDIIRVNIDAENIDIGLITVSDVSGKQIYSRRVEITQGSNAFTVNTGSFSHGAYIMKIKLSDNILVKKFTKQ